jgi:hypothetical protein
MYYGYDLAEYGDSVLQLPPYHLKLNPVKLIWATVKNGVADKNATFSIEDLINLTDGKFTSISEGDWKLRCNHAIATETQYITSKALLTEGHETVVHVRNDRSM